MSQNISTNDLQKKTCLKVGKGITRMVSSNEITHLVCDEYITTVFLIDGNKITISRLLKCFEEELKPFGFIRPNRCTLVNAYHIDKVSTVERKRYIHIGDFTIPVSRRKIGILGNIMK